MISKALFHLAPLAQNEYSPLPIGAIRPRDWLREELSACLSGMTERLNESIDETESLFNVDKALLFAYHMDAVILLSSQLRDDNLMKKAESYIRIVMDSQDPSGAFGPDDTYVRAHLLRAVIHYYISSGDHHVLSFLLRYFRYLYLQMEDEPLTERGLVVSGELAYQCMWTYDLTNKSFLLKLAEQILEQGLDWTSFFHSFPYTGDMKKSLPWQELEAGVYRSRASSEKQYYLLQMLQSNGVNIAQGLEQPMVAAVLNGGLKQSQAFSIGYDRLMKAHGVANGMYTCDTHLSGDSPSQGTETLAIAEFLHSLEINMAQSSSVQIPDVWEKVAYNALPASVTADYRAQQTIQQANQITVNKANRDWYNMGDMANLFSTQSNIESAAVESAIGSFVSRLWMASSNGGVTAMSYAPCSVRWHIQGEPYRIYVESNYPFDSTVRFTVRSKVPLRIPITLRIPKWAEGARVYLDHAWQECENGKFHTIDRTWDTEEGFLLELPMPVSVSRWQHQSASVERGPVVYALRIGEKESRFGSDYGYEAVTPWNYALLLEEGFSVESFKFCRPFGGQYPVVLRARGVRITDWRTIRKSASAPPVLPNVDADKAENIDLVPYGCTRLRITEFPVGLEAETFLQNYLHTYGHR